MEPLHICANYLHVHNFIRSDCRPPENLQRPDVIQTVTDLEFRPLHSRARQPDIVVGNEADEGKDRKLA